MPNWPATLEAVMLLASLKAKAIIAVVILLIGGGGVLWFKSVLNERNQLRADVIVFERNEKVLKDSLESERLAATQAVSDRADAQRALDNLREGRENDVESQEWAATELPNGEVNRLCLALPQMKGCLRIEARINE